MRKDSFEYIKQLGKRDLTQDMNCLNSLMDTPWRINEFVLSVMEQAWMSGQEWAGLPARDDIPLPAYPFDKLPEEMDEFETIGLKEWKKARAQIHAFNNKTMSKRIQLDRTLQLARRYTDFKEFFYVWQMDFRGRKYPVESFMTPQSADTGKSLLEFAEGTPITCHEDAKWLAIHGANVYGNDKISLLDREIWAYEQVEHARNVVADPLGYTWWTQADKPWQCLAWCYEWAAYADTGFGFETHLPVAMDGSCNGLQWLSALMRDESGGRAVNLCPADKPQDIYSDVAKATTERLKREADEGHMFARQLLDFGIDRSICKRPVMIVPYSGTLFACRDYILEAISDKVAKSGKPAPWGDEHWEVSTYLAKHVWDAIGDVIVAAKQVMDYVKYIGGEYAKANQPMEWETPTGFWVRQAYPDLRKRRLETHLNGSIVKLNVNEEVEGKINTSKTKSGASPNFIHSLDASHLTRVVNQAKKEGIHLFAMIHDSFGCPSPQAQRLNEITREEFALINTEHDPLMELKEFAEFKLGKKLENPPSKGTLNLEDVLKSNYFFA